MTTQDDNIRIFNQIMQVSDRFYDKHGYEAEVVYLNKSIYLQLLREKVALRKEMQIPKLDLYDRIVMGMEVKLQRSNRIKVKMRKK